ncbi:6452_t:CDS:2 [Paraglomus brasilianum]|uniref:6452_t:CDS:1 n=1 Tax=Paraglomus brasilianum TaxID=144538 RepID=A0A9N9CCQ6_9GLOM|nr:6452_t:CDS:2 [Paraglomus brasilianum]
MSPKKTRHSLWYAFEDNRGVSQRIRVEVLPDDEPSICDIQNEIVRREKLSCAASTIILEVKAPEGDQYKLLNDALFHEHEENFVNLKDSFAISKKVRSLGIRHFQVGTEVYPDRNFYIEPDNVKKLADALLNGDFYLLYGHRQSGKSTIAHATARYLQNMYNIDIKGYGRVHPEVYLISLSSGVIFNKSVNSFWSSICLKLQSKNPARFIFDDKEAQATTFENFFQRNQSSSPVILLIDEASILVNKDPTIINSFIGMLRLLKGDETCCLHGLALIGVESVKQLLRPCEGHFEISPFTQKGEITPRPFNELEIKELLLQYVKEANIDLDTISFAADIYERTIGHKGLVGVCCMMLEEMAESGDSVSIDKWRQYASMDLVQKVRQLATYTSIVHALPYLSKMQMNMLVLVLRYGSTIVPWGDALSELLSEGMVRVVRNFSLQSVEIECTAPILRTIMLYNACGTKIQGVQPPQLNCINPRWLLARTYMAWENIFAPQTMNSNNKPSEYAVQAEFVSILKELLNAAHASLLYRVLAEAKEHDEDGQRHRRLNILLHDHNLPPFGFELVISATQDKFDKHLGHAAYYSQLHKCSMYMVNFCNDKKLITYFGAPFDGITSVHVIYSEMGEYATIVYQDQQETVTIKGWKWSMLFDTNY